MCSTSTLSIDFRMDEMKKKKQIVLYLMQVMQGISIETVFSLKIRYRDGLSSSRQPWGTSIVIMVICCPTQQPL